MPPPAADVTSKTQGRNGDGNNNYKKRRVEPGRISKSYKDDDPDKKRTKNDTKDGKDPLE